MNDKTWEITIKVKVTTMSGWKPEREDIESWLNDGSLELTSIEQIKEVR